MPTRRHLLGTLTILAATAPAAPRIASAARHVFKYGSTLPASHPVNVRLREAAEHLLQQTKGQLEIRVFSDSQLGGDSEMLQQVRSGALECMTVAGLILATFVPAAASNGMGFAFESYDTVWRAMDGEVGARIRDAIGKARLSVLEKPWDNGFRQITTGQQRIERPEDLAGLKIRVPVSPLYISLFQKLGAASTSLTLGETYTALQTNLVGGQENPLVVAETAKLYEVQKFCAMTNHIWDGLWFLVSPRAWARLPTDLQQLASSVLNEAALQQRGDVAALGARLQSELQEKGMTFTTPDRAPFRQKLQQSGFYTEWKGKFEPDLWQALERYVGRLA
jgi:TRAP-type transport system periplasmic protein